MFKLRYVAAALVALLLASLLLGFIQWSSSPAKEISATQLTRTTNTTNLNSTALPQKIAHARIVVFKSKRRLQLFDGEKLLREYRIALGSKPIGHKYLEGDRATPEADYYISHKNPNSQFYLSLGISYPNINDAQFALSEKRISRSVYNQIVSANQSKISPPQKTALGGDIMIHGNGNASDWTWGCIALDDTDIKELYGVIREQTPIKILP